MSEVSRYAQIWLAQMRYAITRELMFKANFILWVIVDLEGREVGRDRTHGTHRLGGKGG